MNIPVIFIWESPPPRGKSQTIGDFAVSRTVPDFAAMLGKSPIIAEIWNASWRRKNRNAPDFPDLSPTILNDRDCLRLISYFHKSAKSGTIASGNSEIPDHLGFSLRMKSRLIPGSRLTEPALAHVIASKYILQPM